MQTNLLRVLNFVEQTYFSQSIPELLYKSSEFFVQSYNLSNCSLLVYDTHHRAITNGALSQLYRRIEDAIYPILRDRKTSYHVSRRAPDACARFLLDLDTDVSAYPILARGEFIGVLYLYGSRNLADDHQTISALLEKLSRVAMHVKGYTEVKHSAMCDPMTGLFNKAYFEEATKRELASATTKLEPTSLVIIDLDDFKKYNDTKGHIAGDHLLKELAGCLKREAKRDFVVSRFGGEEFVILLPRTSSQSAAAWAESLRQSIERDCDATASIGVATCMKSKSSYSSLLKAADDVMYRSKKCGKNRVTQSILLDPSISPITNAIEPQSL